MLPLPAPHLSSSLLPQLLPASTVTTLPSTMVSRADSRLRSAKRAVKCTAGSPAADSAACVRLTTEASAPAQQSSEMEAIGVNSWNQNHFTDGALEQQSSATPVTMPEPQAAPCRRLCYSSSTACKQQ